MKQYELFTSESVTEGHPDKVCDLIADTILDAALKDDPEYLAKWKELWSGFGGDYNKLAKDALGWTEAWDMDMNGLHPEITATVAKYLKAMDTKGMPCAVECVVTRGDGCNCK